MDVLTIDRVKVAIKQKEGCSDLPLPKYMSDLASGMDLYAAVEEPVILKRFERKLISTGISIALPEGYEAQIRPRSGLAVKHGISVVNSPGTIDADYRGDIGVILINLGEEDFEVTRGMRVAQMIISAVSQANFEVVDDLSETDRSAGGFGHTGL
jgi:dUTP pyrophosphatase